MEIQNFHNIVIKPFLPLYEHCEELTVTDDASHARIIKRNNYLLVSGRNGGKTRGFIGKMYFNAFKYPKHDIQILRANSSSLKESVFLEFKKYCFEKLPTNVFNMIVWRESPPLMITMPYGNQIRFGGVGLGSKSSSNQSRGKTAERPFSLIIFEETQEIFSGTTGGEDLLNHAINTYIRNLDDKIGKVIYAGNRERNINSKFNQWAKRKEKDKSFKIIETSWLDIRNLLNNATVQMILTEKELNPNNYRFLYMGEAVGGNDVVYSAFTENKHVLPKEEIEDIFTRKEMIHRLYVGVDASSTVDVTCFMPIFHFKNNKMILRSKDIIHHNPKQNGTITNSMMAKIHVKQWLKTMIDEYGLYRVPIVFVVDGHAADMIQNLMYELAPFSNVSVIKFTHKDLVQTAERVNNAFVNNTLYLSDEDFKELTTQQPIPVYKLIDELQTVCWREDDSTKFNESIDNDMTDGIRYPVAFHAESPYQLKDFSRKGGE